LTLGELELALQSADKVKAPETRDKLWDHFMSLAEAPSLDETVETNRAAHR
jgi:hypothetical protein